MLPNSAFDFDYSVWQPGTTITLCNVPWDSTYRDIVKFNSNRELDNYINSLTSANIVIERMTVLPPNEPIRLAVPHNVAQHYNYIRVVNPAKAVGDKVFPFYYFIGNAQYIAENTTQLNVQLDVWSTYGNYVTFGNSYVKRGHVGIAQNVAATSMNELAVPEGLDIGSEYETVMQYRHDISNFYANGKQENNPLYVVYSAVSLTADPGTEDNPHLTSSKGVSLANGFSVNADVYIIKHTDIDTFFRLVGAAPWVSQGIMAVFVIPDFNIDTSITAGGNPVWNEVSLMGDSSCKGYVPHLSRMEEMNDVHVRKEFVKHVELLDNISSKFLLNIPSKYRHLKKFATSPYSVLELTAYSGAPIILKPEQLDKDDLNLIESVFPFPPAPRVTYGISDYNTRESNTTILDRGEYFDISLSIGNCPQLPITNNSYAAYMASNKNSINYNYSSAEWSQQKALQGNKLAQEQSYANVNAGIDSNQLSMGLMNTMNSISNDQAWGHEQVAMGTGGISALGNLVTGNFGGAINSAVGVGAGYLNYDIDKTARNAGNAAQVSNMAAQQNIKTGLGQYMADSNRKYADFAAQGDYSNAIAGIQAKVQDAKMLQPTVSGQLGGELERLYNFGWKINIKFKTITLNAIRIIGDYWLRYGYEVDRFCQIPKSLQVMNRFTYWQLQATYLTGQISEEFKNTIRGIFEKGVTVWNNPNDIGMDTANTTNTPIMGTYF